MLLKRFVFDLIFWALANLFVFLAAKDATFLLHDQRGQIFLSVLNILWLIPVIGDAYVPQAKIKSCTKEYLYYLTMGVLLLAFVGATYEYTHFRNGNSLTSIETISGIAVIGLGFLVSLVGWLSIRRYSAPRLQIIEGHKVVNSGLYSLIRHPICLSVFLIAAGVTVLLRSVAGIAILILIVAPVWIYIVKEEEKFLLSNLGNDYLIYLEKTKRFIPFVY